MFDTADDTVVRTDGRIGNIGSNSNRFAVIGGYFRATGNIDLNASGNVSADVWSMKDIDDRRSGRTLSDTVAAGDDVDSILADLITSPLICAGYAPGADGEFTWGGDDVLSGMNGDIRNVTGTSGISASFRASDDILSLASGGFLCRAGDALFAGDDMGTIRSAGDIDFGSFRSGDLTGTGVIHLIEVNEENDFDGYDPSLLCDFYASLRVDRIAVVCAALPGTPLPSPAAVLDLDLDTDGDGV